MGQVVIVGGGRMGEALARGLVAASWAEPGEIWVCESRSERRQELQESLKGLRVVEAPPREGIPAVLAVKPHDAARAAASLREAGARKVLSIMAGVRLAQLQEWLGPKTAVMRAMPNVGALVGHSASALSAAGTASPEDVAWAQGLLGSVGVCVRVSEELLDAVTGLSGSGPAYLALVAEAMVEGGVAAGLGRNEASRLVAETFLGAAKLISERGVRPSEVREMVTSPGGTTAAGLLVLEQAAVRAAFVQAVLAGRDRATQLG